MAKLIAENRSAICRAVFFVPLAISKTDIFAFFWEKKLVFIRKVFNFEQLFLVCVCNYAQNTQRMMPKTEKT